MNKPFSRVIVIYTSKYSYFELIKIGKQNMATGTVKWFNSRKGYGFITSSDDETDIFVHYSSIVVNDDGFKTLNQGDEVTFDVEEGKKGPEAKNVVITKAAPKPSRPRRFNRY
ncbi:MAG: cold-shock protein [Candidatus Helarchaeota archaeon]